MTPTTISLSAAAPTPPRLPGLPLLGNLLEANRDLLATLTRAASLGDVVRLHLGEPLLFINRPDLIKHVLDDNAANYRKSGQYERLEPLVGRGLLTSDGDHWRRSRALAQPAFHRERIAAFVALMSRHTAALVERWEQHADDGKAFDAEPELAALTLAITTEALFSNDLGTDTADFAGALEAALRVTDFRFRVPFQPPAWLPTPGKLRFDRAGRTLDRVLGRIITARRKSGEAAGDLLGMFMAACDSAGAGLNDLELRDEVLTVLLGGYHTTSPALSWWVWLMAENPSVAHRQATEAREVLAGRAAVALADLPRLDLTRRTFEETLRLYPSAYVVGRRALAADRLGGYRIGPGESVFMSSAITGRDRRYWDDPSTFDPDRFLPGRSAGRPAMACFPFGGGPRKCLGDTFATMELQVIGAMLARRFELELVSGQHLEVDPQLSLRPRHGVSIKVRRRDDLRLESTR